MYIAALNGTAILTQLRALMVLANIQAYIVPTADPHHSDDVAACHKRRAYITEFTGSAGTAIVTLNEALLYTDGRYWTQAEQQLDPQLWTLMREGFIDVPSQAQWLKDNLPPGSLVGVDPNLYTKLEWDTLTSDLATAGKRLEAVPSNLVDTVWAEDRPPCGSAPVFEQELQYSGESTSDKVARVRAEMSKNSVDALVVTELDEVAWLVNLRGTDIPYYTVFFAYIIVTPADFYLFTDQDKLLPEIIAKLEADIPGIQIGNYEDIQDTLQSLGTTSNRIWFNQNTNYALASVIPSSKQLMQLTPVSMMKAEKNPTEVEGFRRTLIRDAAALCEFFAWLEAELGSGANVTEIDAADKLTAFRAERENYFSDAFPVISASGSNAAIIHYFVTPETNRVINNSDIYLVDSGGHYRDGTTDITRTIHLGNPTPRQKNCYTRVLKGQMALTRAPFPSRTTGHRLDSFARQFLWQVGLDYNHGTGHAMGSFLTVHAPYRIGLGYTATDPGFRENFVTSIEPGYYEPEAFGIRLENIAIARNASLDNNFENRGWLQFEEMTFVPYDHKLIEVSLLTEEELDYLNKYQEKVRELVGGYIRDNNMSDAAYDWMWKSTVPLTKFGPVHPIVGIGF